MSKLFKASKRNNRPAAPTRESATSPPTLSVIAADMRLEGAIDVGGIVKVEGTIVGDVRSDRQVLVAAGGRIIGNVSASEAIVDGNVQGSIKATARVELQSKAVVQGDITTDQLLLHEGGRVNGRLLMKTENVSAESEPLHIPRVRLKIAATETIGS